MRLSVRVRALERQVASHLADDRSSVADEWDRRREVFLAWVPEDLRGAVTQRLDGPYAENTESYASWSLWPFARWAPEPGSEFRFPRVFVEWLLAPPRRFWMGHSCGRCGLSVPLYSTASDDPDPPKDLRVFPLCPACGGTTSHAASYRPDTEVLEASP